MKTLLSLMAGLFVAGSLPGSAQPVLETSTSRLMTEVELESIANLWRGDPQSLMPQLDQSFAVNLAGYGNIYFLSLLDLAAPNYSSAFSHWLIEGGRVRWELPTSEEVLPTTFIPLSLDAVVFTELNFDGLDDIYLLDGKARALSVLR